MFQPPMIYFLFLGAILGIGIIIFRKFQTRDTVKRFQGQTLNEVIEGENIEPYVKTFGRKTRSGKLITELNTIFIRRVVKAKFKYAEKTNTKGTKNTFELKESDFFIFQSGKSFLVDIPILNKLIGKKEYYVVNDNSKDKDFITKDKFRDTWVLNSNTFLYQLAGIWVCSEQGKQFITEIVYKKIFENLKEADMNYPQRVIWYNDIYASKMTGTEQQFTLERKKWEDRTFQETGVRPSGAS